MTLHKSVRASTPAGALHFLLPPDLIEPMID